MPAKDYCGIIRLGALAVALGALASAACAQPVQHVQQLLAFDGVTNDEYGSEVASALSRIAVGSPRDADAGVQSGAIYMYKAGVSGSWSFQQKILAPDATANRFFGQRLAMSGGFGPATSLLAAGTPIDPDNGNQTGAVYMFIETPVVAAPWGFVKKIYSPSPQLNSRYGDGVDLENDLLIAGQPGNGHAFIHQRNEGGSHNWGSIATLLPPAPVFNVYAESVGISGDVAIVSDRGDPTFGSSSGAAYIFTKDVGGLNNWGFTKKLLAPDGEAQDTFGLSVDVAGEFAACGAQGDDDLASRSGAVYLFARNAGGADNWGFHKKILPPIGHTDLFFGREVKMDGGLLLVGTYQDNTDGNNAGAAYVFGRDIGGADNWGLLTKVVSPDPMLGDHFAEGIAITGDIVTSGIRLDDDNGSNSGSARVYVVKSLCPEDLNGDGMVDTADLGILIAAFGMSGLGDINSDGVVDTADLGILIGGFSTIDCAFVS